MKSFVIWLFGILCGIGGIAGYITYYEHNPIVAHVTATNYVTEAVTRTNYISMPQVVILTVTNVVEVQRFVDVPVQTEKSQWAKKLEAEHAPVVVAPAPAAPAVVKATPAPVPRPQSSSFAGPRATKIDRRYDEHIHVKFDGSVVTTKQSRLLR
jgi:hypothetical protein